MQLTLDLLILELTMYIFQGADFAVDGGLSKAYVTPIGEPALPPPSSLI